MKKIDLGHAVTILANLGVLAGIIFLAFEINQNTATMRTAAYQSRTDAVVDLYGLVAESEVLSSALAKMRWSRDFCNPDPSLIDDLTEQEEVVLVSFLRAQFFRLDNATFQYEEGTLDPDYYERATLSVYAQYLPWWEIFRIPQAAQVRALLAAHEIDGQGPLGRCNI